MAHFLLGWTIPASLLGLEHDRVHDGHGGGGKGDPPFDPKTFDADYNRNGRRDETIPWTHEMTARASLRMVRQLRQRFGDAAPLHKRGRS